MSKFQLARLQTLRDRITRTGAVILNHCIEVDCIHITTSCGHVRMYWDGEVESSFTLARA